MANYTKSTLVRIGRLMSSGEPGDPPPLSKLAKSGAFGRKALYNWSLPETDPQHRSMPAIAKRMIATLAYFSAAGLLTEKRMEEIISLEATFEDETETAAVLRGIKRVVGSAKVNREKAKAAAAIDEDPDSEKQDLSDDDIADPLHASELAASRA